MYLTFEGMPVRLRTSKLLVCGREEFTVASKVNVKFNVCNANQAANDTNWLPYDHINKILSMLSTIRQQVLDAVTQGSYLDLEGSWV